MIASFVLWWTVFFVVDVLVFAAIEFLLDAWEEHVAERQRRQDALQHMADEQAAAVQRIGSAFVLAQQLIRHEAAASRGERP